MKKKRAKRRVRSRSSSTGPRRAGRGGPAPEPESATGELLRELTEHTGVSPADTGGDVDADGQRAQSSGEESVGGSVATPDQSVVDELARPLGVERPPEAPVITSDEILSARDRRRWKIEQHTEERERTPTSPDAALRGPLAGTARHVLGRVAFSACQRVRRLSSTVASACRIRTSALSRSCWLSFTSRCAAWRRASAPAALPPA